MIVNNKEFYLLPIDDGGITKAYGVKDSRYYSGKHLGIDFGWCDNAYSNVYSVDDGLIVATYSDSELGNVVVISHNLPDGYVRYSGYIHLHQIKCSFGQKVKMGDVIGVRGNTGSASNGVHLHLYLTEKTKTQFDLSRKVRATGWKTFLNLCTINPLPLLYKSKSKSYTLAKSLSDMKYMEDCFESKEDKMKQALDELNKSRNNICNELLSLEEMKLKMDETITSVKDELSSVDKVLEVCQQFIK